MPFTTRELDERAEAAINGYLNDDEIDIAAAVDLILAEADPVTMYLLLLRFVDRATATVARPALTPEQRATARLQLDAYRVTDDGDMQHLPHEQQPRGMQAFTEISTAWVLQDSPRGAEAWSKLWNQPDVERAGRDAGHCLYVALQQAAEAERIRRASEANQ
jgi:hypothetical protein